MADLLPLDRGRPLVGLDLRHAAIAVLQRRASASIAELLDALADAGFTVGHDRGGQPNKVLADALRWEVARGRLRRVSWGRYAVARLAKTTAWRIRQRWHNATSSEPVAYEPLLPAVVAAIAAAHSNRVDRMRGRLPARHYVGRWRRHRRARDPVHALLTSRS